MMVKSNQITINVKTFSMDILKYYIGSFFSIIKKKEYSFKMQPTKYKTLTVLRSPHKYKKAQEHFQVKIFSANLTLKNITTPEASLFLVNKPKGVFLKIKVEEKLSK